MIYKIVPSTLTGEPISVWECPACGTTYRTKIVIKRYWNFCPCCGEPIESWEEEE